MLPNQYILIAFAPMLILTGLLGFVVPREKGLMSGEPAYNVFHLVFGIAGLFVAFGAGDGGARAFNVGFGAIDLYQAAASFGGWFPATLFKWKRADDVLHIVIGAFLVAAGAFL
jgi:hypothetical protein